MKFSNECYLFLSKFIPLSLSTLKYININPNHPFLKIESLSGKEIEEQLIILNEQPGIIVQKIKEKVEKFQKYLNHDILENIKEKIKRWSESGIRFRVYFDKDYPERLKGLKNAPKVLFYKGNIDFEYKKAISIIGTRDATDHGLLMAKRIGKRFAELDFVIINGFAKGIDIEAIKGALEAKGRIIGVLGSGLFHPYPKENINFYNEIIEKKTGVFISEQLPEDHLTKANLAARNRISSALSLGNIIIEAGNNSGTRWQLDYGKDQGKPIITLKPTGTYEQAYLPNEIIKNEENCFIIKDINDVDNIAISILKIEEKDRENNKTEINMKQKNITDF